MLSFLYGPTLTSIHDHWENHSSCRGQNLLMALTFLVYWYARRYSHFTVYVCEMCVSGTPRRAWKDATEQTPPTDQLQGGPGPSRENKFQRCFFLMFICLAESGLSCDARAQYLGLVAELPGGTRDLSFPTRGRTHVSCTVRRIPLFICF